jgi:predicted DNA-binding protein
MHDERHTLGFATMTTRKKAPKSVQMSFRMTEECRDLLVALADDSRRSQANLLEIAIRNLAEQTNLTVPSAPARVKVTKKKATKKR